MEKTFTEYYAALTPAEQQAFNQQIERSEKALVEAEQIGMEPSTTAESVLAEDFRTVMESDLSNVEESFRKRLLKSLRKKDERLQQTVERFAFAVPVKLTTLASELVVEENEEMLRLRDGVVTSLKKGAPDAEAFGHYQSCAEKIADQESGSNGRIAVQLLNAAIGFEGKQLEYFKECLQDAILILNHLPPSEKNSKKNKEILNALRNLRRSVLNEYEIS